MPTYMVVMNYRIEADSIAKAEKMAKTICKNMPKAAKDADWERLFEVS